MTTHWRDILSSCTCAVQGRNSITASEDEGIIIYTIFAPYEDESSDPTQLCRFTALGTPAQVEAYLVARGIKLDGWIQPNDL